MITEGSSGRGAVSRDDEALLAGVLDADVDPAGRRKLRCANPRCGRWFTSRQQGDDYCGELCDFDDNPSYRGKSKQK